MNLIGSKKIETERLILRPTEEQDLKTLWKIILIPEIREKYLICKINEDWEKEKKWQYKKLEQSLNDDTFMWSIVLKETNECIGQISVQENGEDKTIRDLGWFIDPKHQGKGLATEAATTIIKYMFEEVCINGIETGAAVSNPTSWKILVKLGFVNREEYHTCNYPYGGIEECCCYGMTAEEYKNNNKRLNLKI